jgi:hypothetical protein
MVNTDGCIRVVPAMPKIAGSEGESVAMGVNDAKIVNRSRS